MSLEASYKKTQKLWICFILINTVFLKNTQYKHGIDERTHFIFKGGRVEYDAGQYDILESTS